MISLPATIPAPDLENPFQNRAKELADYLLSAPPPRVGHHLFNWAVMETRLFGKYVLTLAGAWVIWKDERYAERAWFFLQDAMTWKDWCYMEWDWNKELHFDLATGEMAVFFATASNWLASWLSKDQKKRIALTIRERILKKYLLACPLDKPEEREWWWVGDNNWNSVCNGGAAIAADMWPEFPESAHVRALAWRGLDVFLEKGVQRDGSSLEGIGYWQYGTLYLLYALHYWETSNGSRHPALDGTAFNEGFDFPFDFSPQSVPIGYCDVNIFEPAAALIPFLQRAGRVDLVGETARRLLERWGDRPAHAYNFNTQYHPDEILSAVYLSVDDLKRAAAPKPATRMYPDCGWVVMRSADATLALRGGSTKVNHAMKELLAVNLARDGKSLLAGRGSGSYSTGWFNGNPSLGERRASRALHWEENSPSKCTPLANGIGQVCYADSTLIYSGEQGAAFDATEAYPYFIEKIERHVTHAKGGFLITDNWLATSVCHFEARFVIAGEVEIVGENSVRINNEGRLAVLEFDAGQHPLKIDLVQAIPSLPVIQAPRMVRAYIPEVLNSATISTRIYFP